MNIEKSCLHFETTNQSYFRIAKIIHTMDEHTKKYHTLIEGAVRSIVKRPDDPNHFEKHYLELQAVVPKFGFTSGQFNLILDIIVDTQSKFKNSLKSKLVDILVSRDLLDFKTILKILSVFKVNSYYNVKSKVKNIPKNIQIKLSLFLTKNFINIKWDHSYVQILNLLFGILSIGYLRLNIGLFLVYILNNIDSINKNYKLTYFFNIKKLEIILEFYNSDSRSSLALLVFAKSFLNSINKNDNFELISEEYNIILHDLRIPKGIFGKIDYAYVESLKEMSTDIKCLENNINLYTRILENLNTSLSTISNFKKRKFLHDSNIEFDLTFDNIYTTDRLCESIKSDKSIPNIIDFFKFFSNVDLSNSFFSQTSTIIKYLSYFNADFINLNIQTILDIKVDQFTVSSDMNWIFKSISNLVKITSMNIPIINELFQKKLTPLTEVTNEHYFKSINAYELIQFLDPNYDAYKSMINEILDIIFKTNNLARFQNIVILAYNWIESPANFNKLLLNVLNRFKFVHFHNLMDELLILISFMHKLPHDSIDISLLILKPDIVSYNFFSNDLNKLNLLLQHILFCKLYYSEYGIKQIENNGNNIKLKQLKELHNSYVLDTCNSLWRGKKLSQTRFKFPPEFMDSKFNTYDLINLSAIKSLNIDIPSDTNELDHRIIVLNKLKDLNYLGIYNFLHSSIRSLQKYDKLS